MAIVKNFGLKGIGSDVQFGKGGGTLSFADERFSLGSSQVTGVLTPEVATDLASKGYVDSVAQGLDFKESVLAATTENISLSGPMTIDGVDIVGGERVLVKDQGDKATNGIYIASAGAWARAADFDQIGEAEEGAYVFVEDGSVNKDSSFVVTDITGGAVTWTVFGRAGELSAGTGISIDSQIVSTDFSGFAAQGNIDGAAVLIYDVNKKGTVADLVSGMSLTNTTYVTGAIATEHDRATEAEGTLQTNINTEVSNRTEADTALGLRIDNADGDILELEDTFKAMGVGIGAAAGLSLEKTDVDTANDTVGSYVFGLDIAGLETDALEGTDQIVMFNGVDNRRVTVQDIANLSVVLTDAKQIKHGDTLVAVNDGPNADGAPDAASSIVLKVNGTDRIVVTDTESTFTNQISANAGLVANTVKITDLSAGRVVLAGTDGEIEDSLNLTFDGTTLSVTGNATVTGTLGAGATSVTSLAATGAITGASVDTGAGSISGGAISGTDGTFTGAVGFGTLSDGTTSINGFATAIANDATTLPTTKAVYDAIATSNSDANLQISNGVDTALNVNLESDTLVFTGVANETVVTVSENAINVALADDVSGLTSVSATTLTDTVASLSAGSLTGAVNGSFSGAVGFGTLSDGSISIDSFIDDDTMATASATTLATSESVKAYVDAQVTAQDLDFSADGGTGVVDLDSQALSFTGGANITSAAAGQDVTFALDADISLTSVTATGTVAGGTLTDGTATVTGGAFAGTSLDVDTADLGDLSFTTNSVTSAGDINLLPAGDVVIGSAGAGSISADAEQSLTLSAAGIGFVLEAGSLVTVNDAADYDATLAGNDGSALTTKSYVDDAIATGATYESLKSVIGTVDLSADGTTNLNVSGGTTLPANAVVQSVRVRIMGTLASEGTELTIGNNGSAAYMAADENDMASAGTYVSELYMPETSPAQVTATVSGFSQGTAQVIVEYRVPAMA